MVESGPPSTSNLVEHTYGIYKNLTHSQFNQLTQIILYKMNLEMLYIKQEIKLKMHFGLHFRPFKIQFKNSIAKAIEFLKGMYYIQ